MRALVTGACGFLGTALATQLLAGGAEVIGIDAFCGPTPRERQHRNRRRLEHAGAQIIRADVCAEDPVAAAGWATHVFHLAGLPGARAGWDQIGEYRHANIDATLAVLRACRAAAESGAPVEKVVIASSSSVYGSADGATPESAAPKPLSPYAVTKLAAEQLALAQAAVRDVPVLALRYFTVYGPGQRPDMAFHRAISAALCGDVFTLHGDGGQRRSFTYIDDAIDATIRAAQAGTPGRIYNIAGPEPVALREALETIERICGTQLRTTHVPEQSTEAHDTWADTSRAEADLGVTCETPLATGLARQVLWHRLHLPAAYPALGPSAREVTPRPAPGPVPEQPAATATPAAPRHLSLVRPD